MTQPLKDIDYPKERKQLVREFAGPPQEPAEYILKQHNITPLPKRTVDPDTHEIELSPYIGKGSYGKVFRAVFQGKEVAVKLIQGGDGKVEVDNWKTILQIADSMPPNLKKHLPKIYKLTYNEPSNTYIVAMEILQPLPRQLAERLFQYRKEKIPPPKLDPDTPPLSQKQLQERESYIHNQRKNQELTEFLKVFKNPNILHKALQYGLKLLISENTFFADPDFQSVWDALFIKMLNFTPNPNKTIEELHFDFQNYWSNAILQTIESLPPKKKEKLSPFTHNINDALSTYSLMYLTEAGPKFSFPLDSYDPIANRLTAEDVPEASSLLQTLEYLESYGISWTDTHSSNLMIRPSTGDIVIIDVGLWIQ